MATIDLEKLLAPISADAPAGENLEEAQLFNEMERAAEGKEERQIGDTITPAEEPDWRTLKHLTEQVLAQSKDLRAATLLTRALIHLEGYPGLSDGLALIQGFVTDYWDSLHPQLDPDDDNDPTLRINTLSNLCDPIASLGAIKRIPVVSSKVLGRFGLREIEIAEGALAPANSREQGISLEQIEGAFRESPTEELRARLAHIRHANDNGKKIETALNQLVGIEQAPDLKKLLEILQHAERAITSRVSDTPAPETDADPDAPGSMPVGQQQAGSDAQVRNREDVVRTLERLCLYYQQSEPSSPVPLLLERAKRLVHKDFFDIVQDLAPDGSSHFDFLWKQDEST